MKKILYVILHGEVYKERYHNIKDTWGKDKDLLFYGDYEDIDKGIIKVSENKSYRSNEEKHINVLKYFNENSNYNYEWFFFCDDDTFVNVNKLEELLPTKFKIKVRLVLHKISGIPERLEVSIRRPNLQNISRSTTYNINEVLPAIEEIKELLKEKYKLSGINGDNYHGSLSNYTSQDGLIKFITNQQTKN